jgi:hypothetical protein
VRTPTQSIVYLAYGTSRPLPRRLLVDGDQRSEVEGVPAKFLKIPAHIFTYLLGQAEWDVPT